MKPYYDNGQARIYLGDALEILPQLDIPRESFAFTDPPYNIGLNYGEEVNDAKPGRIFEAWQALWIEHLRAKCDRIAVYCPAKHTRAMWGLLGDDFWQVLLTWTPLGPVRKGVTNQHATILTNASFPGNKASGVSDVWTNLPSKRMGYAFHEADYGHPGATSEGITRKAVGSLAGDAPLVLDPFAGTGTTLVIAQERGLLAIGIEKCERWAEVAARRIEQTTPALIPA